MEEHSILNKKISLFSITWPIFMQNTLIMLMGNVNVLMLSRYSDDAVGAVGVSNQIMGMLIVIYNVVAMGSSINISQYLGQE